MRSLIVLFLLSGLAACDPVKGSSDAGGDEIDAGALSCAAYCEQFVDTCTGDLAFYPSVAYCEDYCEHYAGIPLGEEDQRTDNTVACRLYHVTLAAASNPELHCLHASPSGGNTCGIWCDNYCHLAMRNCGGMFDSVDECQMACLNIRADGNPGDERGDTVQCRIHYLGLAGSEPPESADTFCPAALPADNPECLD